MLPFICRCCGERIGIRSPLNPNMCVACVAFGVTGSPDAVAPGDEADESESGSTQKPVELEKLLEIEGPSVLECFHAVEQANEAIREAATQEAQVSSPIPPSAVPTPDQVRSASRS